MNKRIFSVVLACILAFSISACGESSNGIPGTGTKGVVEKIDWSGYDELLEKTMSETNLEKRALMLHEAEEMLIDSGAIGPITSSNDYLLIKPGITGVTFANNGNIDFSRIADASGTKSFGVCVCTEVSKVDPPANTTSDMSNITQNTYACLMKKDGDGNILPDLAESYTVSDDGLTYEFVLRDGLKWSDGSDFSAKDFEYSWKRGAASENAFEYNTMFDCISGYPDDLDVTASDDGKVFTVRLKNPTAYFPELCCHSSYCPVQQKQVEEAEGYKDAAGKLLNPSAWAADGPIVSNGPYTIEEWVHNERIVLKKNPYYYDAGNIHADKITMMLTSDSAAAYSAYLSDSISVLRGLVPSDVLPTLKDSPEYYVCQKLSSRNIMFNVTSSLFDGMTVEEAKTFRKAVITAIDRQFIIDVVNSGNTTVCGTYVPMGMSVGTGKKFSETEGYSYPEETGYYKAQPELDKAREMLRSIGFEFGNDGKLKNPITIEYLYSSNSSNEALAVALQADLAQLGINLSLSSREWAVFLGEESSGNYEMAITTWNADYDDPYNFLALYISDSSNNRAFLGR